MNNTSSTSKLSELCKFLYIVKFSLSLSVIRRLHEDNFASLFPSYFSYTFVNMNWASDVSHFPHSLTELDFIHFSSIPSLRTQAKFVCLLRLIEQFNAQFADFHHCPDQRIYLNRTITASNDTIAVLESIISTVHDVDVQMLSNGEICLFGKSIKLLFDTIGFLSYTQRLIYLDKLVRIMFLIDPFDFNHMHNIFDLYLQLSKMNTFSTFLFYHYSLSLLTRILSHIFCDSKTALVCLYKLFTLSDLFHLCGNCGLSFDTKNLLTTEISFIQMDHRRVFFCNIPCHFPLLSLRYAKLSDNE
eukprot:TRINITY_DN28342_c0_g1_i1.p1 TRINITY_DN28342_c0_g1~~TRINITY_DN28342_c0_g1_i1.p1  ORF type:complete len:301 (-),score=-11.41 TRINITY_DN28342_c0_g1_i1:6-908(-)